MKNNQLPIGIFDSGLGGLTVMKELIKILPHENILYFADNAHLPYGEKSKSYLKERSLAITSFFEEKRVKLIVVACHTASANALEVIQKKSLLPIIGIIQPAIEELACQGKKRIAILATKATIDSGIYEQLIKKRLPDAEIFPLACPKFVPLVEQGKAGDPLTKLIVHQTIKELHKHQIDSALLGSTHYPIIQDVIGQELGFSVQLIDPAAVFAATVQQFLSDRHLLNSQEATGQFYFFSSRDTESFQRQAEEFLGMLKK